MTNVCQDEPHKGSARSVHAREHTALAWTQWQCVRSAPSSPGPAIAEPQSSEPSQPRSSPQLHMWPQLRAGRALPSSAACSARQYSCAVRRCGMAIASIDCEGTALFLLSGWLETVDSVWSGRAFRCSGGSRVASQAGGRARKSGGRGGLSASVTHTKGGDRLHSRSKHGG